MSHPGVLRSAFLCQVPCNRYLISFHSYDNPETSTDLLMLISERFCNLSTATHVLGVAGWAPGSVSLLSGVPQWGWWLCFADCRGWTRKTLLRLTSGLAEIRRQGKFRDSSSRDRALYLRMIALVLNMVGSVAATCPKVAVS